MANQTSKHESVLIHTLNLTRQEQEATTVFLSHLRKRFPVSV